MQEKAIHILNVTSPQLSSIVYQAAKENYPKRPILVVSIVDFIPHRVVEFGRREAKTEVKQQILTSSRLVGSQIDAVAEIAIVQAITSTNTVSGKEINATASLRRVLNPKDLLQNVRFDEQVVVYASNPHGTDHFAKSKTLTELSVDKVREVARRQLRIEQLRQLINDFQNATQEQMQELEELRQQPVLLTNQINFTEPIRDALLFVAHIR